MLAQTVERLAGLVAVENILVVTSIELEQAIREDLPELPTQNLILEPVGRNTAPCVALAAFEVARRDPDAVQIVLPADHVIQPAESFRSALKAAVIEARSGHRLVTLGIRPTHPATGYGYIRAGERRGEPAKWEPHEVVSFVEKPDSARAREFLASGDYLWNAGIFVWETSTILAALREHAAAIYEALKDASTKSTLAAAYEQLESAPIDVAVMERADNVSVVPVDFDWNDVGAWPSLADVVPVDSTGNHTSGGVKLVARDAQGCVVYGDGDGLIALVGVENLVIVQSGKTVLVCPRDRAQEVKAIVTQLENEAPEQL